MRLVLRDSALLPILRELVKGHPTLVEMVGEADEAYREANRLAFIEAARELYPEEGDREIAIDDDAILSASEAGAFVMAWVWVPNSHALGTIEQRLEERFKALRLRVEVEANSEDDESDPVAIEVGSQLFRFPSAEDVFTILDEVERLTDEPANAKVELVMERLLNEADRVESIA